MLETFFFLKALSLCDANLDKLLSSWELRMVLSFTMFPSLQTFSRVCVSMGEAIFSLFCQEKPSWSAGGRCPHLGLCVWNVFFILNWKLDIFMADGLMHAPNLTSEHWTDAVGTGCVSFAAVCAFGKAANNGDKLCCVYCSLICENKNFRYPTKKV